MLPERFFLFLFLLVVVSSAGNIDRELGQRRSALAQLKKELREEKNRIRDMKKREKGILQGISLADRELGQMEMLLETLGEESTVLDSTIFGLHREIDSLDRRMDGQRIAMMKRIRSIYLRGRPSGLQTFLNAASVGDAARNWLFLRKLLSYDKNLVEGFRKSARQRREWQDTLSIRFAELEELKLERKKERQNLQKGRRKQAGLLETVQTDVAVRERAVREFEANQIMLQKLIARLEKRKKERETRRKKGGRKLAPAGSDRCWPVRGKVISEFGLHKHEVLKTVTRNLGMEIRGRKGSPVKAAANGEIVLISYIQGRGTGLIMDHGNGNYSVYGHLEKVLVKEGQQVKFCEEIATVGDEESLNGAKLFFQVNKGRETIDPRKWLGPRP